MNGHLTVFYRQDSLSITGFTYMEHGTVRRKFRIISSIRKCCLRGFCCVFLNLCHCFTLFGFFRNLLCNFFCSRGCLFDSRLLLILCLSGTGTHKSHTENQYTGQKDCFYLTHCLPHNILFNTGLFSFQSAVLILLIHSIRRMLYINLLDSFDLTKASDLGIDTVKLTGSLEHA